MGTQFRLYKRGLLRAPATLRAVPSLAADPAIANIDPPARLPREGLNPNFKMFGNDRLSNCTAAAVFNGLIVWEALVGSGMDIPEHCAIDLYSQTTGYSPYDPSSDRGAVEVSVLNYGYAKGFGTPFYKYYPLWGSLDYTSIKQMANVIDKLGYVYQGVFLRAGDMDLLDDDQDLEIIPGMDMEGEGGHALIIYSYEGLNPKDKVRIATWGETVNATWEWVLARSIESHGLLYRQLYSPAHQKLLGLDYASLLQQNKAFLSGNAI